MQFRMFITICLLFLPFPLFVSISSETMYWLLTWSWVDLDSFRNKLKTSLFWINILAPSLEQLRWPLSSIPASRYSPVPVRHSLKNSTMFLDILGFSWYWSWTDISTSKINRHFLTKNYCWLSWITKRVPLHPSPPNSKSYALSAVVKFRLPSPAQRSPARCSASAGCLQSCMSWVLTPRYPGPSGSPFPHEWKYWPLFQWIAFSQPSRLRSWLLSWVPRELARWRDRRGFPHICRTSRKGSWSSWYHWSHRRGRRRQGWVGSRVRARKPRPVFFSARAHNILNFRQKICIWQTIIFFLTL